MNTKFFTLFALLCLLFASCGKDEVDTPAIDYGSGEAYVGNISSISYDVPLDDKYITEYRFFYDLEGRTTKMEIDVAEDGGTIATKTDWVTYAYSDNLITITYYNGGDSPSLDNKYLLTYDDDGLMVDCKWDNGSTVREATGTSVSSSVSRTSATIQYRNKGTWLQEWIEYAITWSSAHNITAVVPTCSVYAEVTDDNSWYYVVSGTNGYNIDINEFTSNVLTGAMMVRGDLLAPLKNQFSGIWNTNLISTVRLGANNANNNVALLSNTLDYVGSNNYTVLTQVVRNEVVTGTTSATASNTTRAVTISIDYYIEE